MITPHAQFWTASQSKRRIIEFGTKRWKPEMPTHHMKDFPQHEVYLMCDIQEGQDVDLVCNLHAPPKELFGKFDCFVAYYVWEHLKFPWLAAEQVWNLLKPGGIFYVKTHQTFPIHGYPEDYFRFTKEALMSCFESKPWQECTAWSGDDCIITPVDNNVFREWNFAARGHLHSEIWGMK